MRQLIISCLLLLIATGIWAQDVVRQSDSWQFTPVIDLEETPIRNQHRTGTCWSFTTASFFESEMIRMGQEPVDLSEMYVVRQVYVDKVDNYIRRQGKAQLGEGGLSHDLVKAYGRYGIVPEEVYNGLPKGATYHDHGELERAVIALANLYAGMDETSPYWQPAIEAILDVYLGPSPESFTWNGKRYTPAQFAKDVVKLDAQDYIEITSFSHHPFYQPFVLEVPDNYSNGVYYNVPLDDLMAIAYHALKQGYTIAWDGDVSEKGFSAAKGIAVVPAHAASKSDINFTGPDDLKEAEVDQVFRQQAFNKKETTDDHLMHITGIVEDQHGKQYFTVKNSWGQVGPYDGFLYMSDAYFRLKTVGIMIHKDALPEEIAAKLGL